MQSIDINMCPYGAQGLTRTKDQPKVSVSNFNNSGQNEISLRQAAEN